MHGITRGKDKLYRIKGKKRRKRKTKVRKGEIIMSVFFFGKSYCVCFPKAKIDLL